MGTRWTGADPWHPGAATAVAGAVTALATLDRPAPTT